MGLEQSMFKSRLSKVFDAVCDAHHVLRVAQIWVGRVHQEGSRTVALVLESDRLQKITFARAPS